MSKKLVVSLFAGAMLLSAGSALAAGIVNGACSDCHTMHNSQNASGVNGTNNTPNDQLLIKNGCAGCHAEAGVFNGVNGKAATAPYAPQVDDPTNFLNGGYFGNRNALTAAVANLQHNIADIGNDPDANIVAAGNAVPGDTAGNSPGLSNAGVAALTCKGCHTQDGHHNIAAGVYRMLTGANTTTRNINYGVGKGVGDHRADTAYDATGMNNVCGWCHGDFHTNGNQAGSAGMWVRHPTDVQVINNANQPSIVALNAAADIDQVVVGSDGATTDIVMCISCHMPHGSANADMLAFTYSATVNAAGDLNRDTGCETCHSYAGSGM